jgi:hypothetical protein
MSHDSYKKLDFEDELDKMGLEVVGRYPFINFGPLDYLDEMNATKETDNFSTIGYAIVRPKREFQVHRYYGENAKEIGQYWMLEEPRGVLGARHDYALFPSWNAATDATKVSIPKEFFFFVGISSYQKNNRAILLGGGLQAFIPRAYLNNLVIASKTNDDNIRRKELEEGRKSMNKFLDNYTTYKREHARNDPDDWRFRCQSCGGIQAPKVIFF